MMSAAPALDAETNVKVLDNCMLTESTGEQLKRDIYGDIVINDLDLCY